MKNYRNQRECLSKVNTGILVKLSWVKIYAFPYLRLKKFLDINIFSSFKPRS